MRQQQTPLGLSFSGREYAKFSGGLKKHFAEKRTGTMDADDFALLQDLGFSANRNNITDAAVALSTTATIGTPVQYLQTMLPGLVRVFQTPMTLDNVIGFTQAGAVEDVQIAQRVLERTGMAREYGDYQSKPNTSWNMNIAVQNVVRFEAGIESHTLQGLQAARLQISDIDEKRQGAQLLLRQMDHYVGWYGYNAGTNLTYGYSNAPSLPAYVPVANGASSSPLWSSKTWAEKQLDLNTMAAGLMSQTQGRVDPGKTDCTLNVPVTIWPYFNETNAFGMSLKQWMREAYPSTRIEVSAQMGGLNGGLNAMYWFADKIEGEDAGSDDGSTFRQVIQSHFMALGVQPLVNGVKEAFLSATAGVFCLRPMAVYRASSM
jgi:hypothetical protein